MATLGQSTTAFPDFLTLRRFSTEDYLQMIEAGVLGPEDHVELIGGIIVDMPPAGPPHNHFLLMANRRFSSLHDQFFIAIQGTLVVAEGEVYDPDFMLLKENSEQYRSKLPAPSDVQLLIEASDSTLRRDQQVKLPVYAKAGIREYWIADVEAKRLLVHRDPEGANYQSIATYSGDDVVSPLAAPDFSLAVRSLFD